MLSWQLAHAIRMLLHYKEVEFVEETYPQGSQAEAGQEEWLKDKFNLGLNIPNVSYISI